jgi:urease accessory protein
MIQPMMPQGQPDAAGMGTAAAAPDPDPLRLMRLLQLADNCFPSGGFAFSNGLESLAKSGHVKSMEGFRQYLDCHLEQIASADMVFLNSFHAQAPHPEGFAAVVREWDAWLFMPSQRKGSLAQGQAWSRAMEETFAEPQVRAVRPGLQAAGLPLHFLAVFAATLRAAGVSRAEAQHLLLHMALRDQLGAAVRLGLLGSLNAQKLHREFIGIGETYRLAHEDLGHETAVRSAPMIDLGQASHPHLYSKLFQS